MRSIGRLFYFVLGFSISIVCLFFAFKGIQWVEVVESFERANLWWLTASFLCQLLALFFAGWRWNTIINLPDVSWAQTSGAMVVGFMVNNILPGRMGELVRPILLGQETKRSRTYLFATVVIDRISDLLVLVTLVLLSFGMFPLISWARQLSIGSGMVLLAGFFAIGLFNHPATGSRIEGIVYHLTPLRFREKVADLLQKLRLGFRSIGSIRHGAGVLLLSWCLWTSAFLSLYLTLHSFRVTVPFWGMVLLLAVLNLGSLVPSSPGYAGTYHLLAVAVLSAFAIKKAEALSFALVFHAAWFIPQTLLGFVVLTKKNLSLWQLAKTKE
jgi:uncharacterized protein (TIRG00374 family)